MSDPKSDHIPQWAVKGLLAIMALIVIPGSIAVISYVFGGIHSELSDHDKAIQSIKEKQAATEARLDRNEANDSSQWKVIGELKDKVAEHNH